MFLMIHQGQRIIFNDSCGCRNGLGYVWHRVALGRKLYSKYFFMLQLKTYIMALQYI